MHLSLLTKIGHGINTEKLTGRPLAELRGLAPYTEDSDLINEYYNEYEEEGLCSEYYLHLKDGTCIVITQVDYDSDEHYTQIVITYVDNDKLISDARVHTIFNSIVKDLEQYECPQYDTLNEVRDVLTTKLD